MRWACGNLLMTLNTTVSTEREEERCPFKKAVRKRPRKRTRRNEDRTGFYLVSNHSFLNITSRTGVNKETQMLPSGSLEFSQTGDSQACSNVKQMGDGH